MLFKGLVKRQVDIHIYAYGSWSIRFWLYAKQIVGVVGCAGPAVVATTAVKMTMALTLKNDDDDNDDEKEEWGGGGGGGGGGADTIINKDLQLQLPVMYTEW